MGRPIRAGERADVGRRDLDVDRLSFRQSRRSHFFVMSGLDPRIHRHSAGVVMEPRVKPEDDEGNAERPVIRQPCCTLIDNLPAHKKGELQSLCPHDTPLCPAGHLPLKGGDRLAVLCRPLSSHSLSGNVASGCGRSISPLVGEMGGKPRGGYRAGTMPADTKHRRHAKARRMKVLRPATSADAIALHAEHDGARFVAGGTALQLEWAKGLKKPAVMIDLTRCKSGAAVTGDEGDIRIDALATLNALIAAPEVETRLPLLQAALKSVAGPSVRNLATIGGNVAGRTGCLLPALLALNAELEVCDAGGSRHIALADWLGTPIVPSQLITAIILKPQPVGARFTWRKTGLRAAFTPSVINVAGLIDIVDGLVVEARLAVGGGVVSPARLLAAEAMLAGRALADVDWAAVHACLIETIAAPDDDFRSSWYRRRVGANALVHGLGGALPSRRRMPAITPPAPAVPLAEEIELSRPLQAKRWFTRPDIEAKIAGTLPYLTDARAEDMLVGRILRAGVPHANILSIDTTAAEALPGVLAVVTHRDITGMNAFGIVIQDQPALCFDKVRYVGDPVAAVATVDAETAERALELIKVVYEPLPIVDSPDRALAEDAPPVHATGNLQRELVFTRGDIVSGFAEAAHVVETTYVTPRQMHGFMETEGGHAFVEPDGTLNIFVGGQHGGRDRMQLSRILGLPEEQIRVVTSPTGGAFGGKDELTVQPALALLALKSGRPVRLQLSRAESILAGQKRNPMTIRMKTGCDASGRLVAQEVEVLADAGAYASLGPGVLETALEHAAGPYVVPHVVTHGRLAYTNNGVCGAFRGFGANQMTFAVECQMDRLAALTGLSSVAIRARNLREAGSPGYLGQVVSPSERVAEMLQAAEASPLWQVSAEKAMDDEWVIGTGMALNYQGNGLGSVVPDPAADGWP